MLDRPPDRLGASAQVRFVLGERPAAAPGGAPVPNYMLAQVREVVTREPGTYRCAVPGLGFKYPSPGARPRSGAAIWGRIQGAGREAAAFGGESENPKP